MDNDKGLDVEFQILATQLDKETVQQGLQIDFGDIEPMTSKARMATFAQPLADACK